MSICIAASDWQLGWLLWIFHRVAMMHSISFELFGMSICIAASDWQLGWLLWIPHWVAMMHSINFELFGMSICIAMNKYTAVCVRGRCLWIQIKPDFSCNDFNYLPVELLPIQCREICMVCRDQVGRDALDYISMHLWVAMARNRVESRLSVALAGSLYANEIHFAKKYCCAWVSYHPG